MNAEKNQLDEVQEPVTPFIDGPLQWHMYWIKYLAYIRKVIKGFEDELDYYKDCEKQPDLCGYDQEELEDYIGWLKSQLMSAYDLEYEAFKQVTAPVR